jgi:peptidoglycan/xylan/chitin deacetylase (PgdA/CDA1 family)
MEENDLMLIRSPLMYQPEREYIFKVIFEEFLGIDYTILFEDRDELEFTLEGCSDKKLLIADIFLQTNERQWLQKASLPHSPLDSLEHPLLGTLPVIFGKRNRSGSYYEKYPHAIYCGLDICGSAFFMLTRYEECVITERDQRNRFLSQHSIAYRENFLNRPIINEYIELLWEAMTALWPKLQRKSRTSKFLMSHDVDWPFYVVGKTALQKLKEVMADIIKRQSFDSAYKKAKAMWKTRSGNLDEDPFNTFRWIMEQSEKAGIRSAFYFITQETAHGLDGNYSMYDPEIKQLLGEIHHRGHEIGLHPSYHTYTNPERIKQQFDILLEVTQANGIYQERWGGRQHYLRWNAPETWQYWEDAGLDYDSTLSYSDKPGFRCGVCYEYSVFNLATRKHLKLKERPLIVMEQTIFFAACMGLKGQEALKMIKHFYEQCMRFNGDFTLLWHNSQLVKTADIALYEDCMHLLQTN